MNCRIFLIRGIDDYERALDVLGLDLSELAGSGESSGSDVDNDIDVGDDLPLPDCSSSDNGDIARYVLIFRGKHR